MTNSRGASFKSTITIDFVDNGWGGILSGGELMTKLENSKQKESNNDKYLD